MYHITYGFLYLISLLPWWIIYLLADGIYVLLYYGFGYRKKVVMNNLRIAFPEKTEQERIRIAKDFYHNFVDNFIEMIKLLSISKESMRKRFAGNVEVLNDLYSTNKNVQVITGHYFNWEFANAGVALQSTFPFVVVYMPLSNKIFDRIVYKLRSRFGSLLLSAPEFKSNFSQYARNRYALILVADQNPPNPAKAYWTNFFGQPTPFVRGPEKGAKMNDTAIVYAHFYKKRRGYYQIDMELITTNPNSYPDGELTKLLVNKVEASVKKYPANYLWSHRRWKWLSEAEKHQHLMV